VGAARRWDRDKLLPPRLLVLPCRRLAVVAAGWAASPLVAAARLAQAVPQDTALPAVAPQAHLPLRHLPHWHLRTLPAAAAFVAARAPPSCTGREEGSTLTQNSWTATLYSHPAQRSPNNMCCTRVIYAETFAFERAVCNYVVSIFAGLWARLDEATDTPCFCNLLPPRNTQHRATNIEPIKPIQ